MFLRISLLCLIVLCCWETMQVFGNNSTPDCCLLVSHKPIKRHLVKSYRIQTADNSCTRNAVVFITRKNKALCAPPGVEWVKALVAKLDKAHKQKAARRKQKTA
ncbi:C-C motif chemokine 19 [Microcaecilia unicolor]|uniref:C-C motif chemokine n=1 Tax=Microcaecilia unicolor TaxID=1415580 RepID=A0A6P7XAZ0_9AMPH|nr:C-C motif chemokine 19-like [Microcaecilia unicolor]